MTFPEEHAEQVSLLSLRKDNSDSLNSYDCDFVERRPTDATVTVFAVNRVALLKSGCLTILLSSLARPLCGTPSISAQIWKYSTSAIPSYRSGSWYQMYLYRSVNTYASTSGTIALFRHLPRSFVRVTAEQFLFLTTMSFVSIQPISSRCRGEAWSYLG
jgi:hypothetical protein